MDGATSLARDAGGRCDDGACRVVVGADDPVLDRRPAGGRYHLGSISRRVPPISMKRWRLAIGVVAAVLGVCAAWYLYDPPWIATVTSGLREWEEDPPGTRFRWTAGRASFFVPSRATAMTLPLRAVFATQDREPVIVKVSVDDRWLADITLTNVNVWNRTVLPLPRRTTHRSYRRVELRVSHITGPYNLGVQVGEVIVK